MKKILLAVAIIILVIYITSNYWLTAYGNYLVVDESPVKSDAIVVLSGGENVLRVSRAVELFNGGYAPRLIMSGGGKLTSKLTDADLMTLEAVDLGIPKTAILKENMSRSTYQNAYYVRNIAIKYKLKSLLLVTSNYHTRRTSYIFNKVFEGTEVKITTVSALDSEFQPNFWWNSHEGQQKALTELPNLIIYWIKY
ncbi:MAG: YdcF family protein [Peptococcaceae bacterium]|nr:YdcF family protein [Peptococcaceae bacterium]